LSDRSEHAGRDWLTDNLVEMSKRRLAGPHATDAANNRVLLETLHGIQPRSARFVCVIALVENDEVRGIFRGTVEGVITEEPRGANGFGYDPLFYYPPFESTFGEATDEQKLSVSHRGQAFRALLDSLKQRRPSH